MQWTGKAFERVVEGPRCGVVRIGAHARSDCWSTRRCFGGREIARCASRARAIARSIHLAQGDATDAGSDVTLDACAYTRGLALTGEARIDDVKGTFSLEAQAEGGGTLTYLRDSDGERTASGDLP